MHSMIRHGALSLLALSVCVSCAHVHEYQPESKPEKIEFSKDRPTIYPDDVRAHLARYTNTPIVWVGIIRNSDAQEEDINSKIRIDTVLEHHYYDWRQTGDPTKPWLAISSRGEGNFRTRWFVHRTDPYMDSVDVDAHDAEKYAAPGKLAVLYGIPQSIDPDGTIVLKYHYIRILPGKDYTTNGVDYGRLGSLTYVTPSTSTR